MRKSRGGFSLCGTDEITKEMKKELYKIYKKRVDMWNKEDPPYFIILQKFGINKNN
jgi:hypothetical protein